MKLLKVVADNFRNCAHIEFDLIPRSKKTQTDKEYELQEIAEGLYTFNTAAIVGKNASGKTTVTELLTLGYELLQTYMADIAFLGEEYEKTRITLYFYYNDKIYRYETEFGATLRNQFCTFKNQKIYVKKYYKSKNTKLFCDEDFALLETSDQVLPENISTLFSVLKDAKKKNWGMVDDCRNEDPEIYRQAFAFVDEYKIDKNLFGAILSLFDQTIKGIRAIEEDNYEIDYGQEMIKVNGAELLRRLSSGTTKGLLLYVMAVASLREGFDLVVDEIENHFQKTLVEMLILLYKDKRLNPKKASLIFTTHYMELLDMFNRYDNIWITKNSGKIELKNAYDGNETRNDLLKSKQFYNNTFDTAIDYEKLMTVKRLLLEANADRSLYAKS